MEDLKVTESVEHAKQWGAPIVVAKSKNDALRIFVDYAVLNNQIVRHDAKTQRRPRETCLCSCFQPAQRNHSVL